MPVTRLLSYAKAHADRFLSQLMDFVRFPSVSAQPKHADAVKSCARWLAEQVRRIGFDQVEVIPTARHPIVYAEWRHAPGRPTVLIYGHYDVQPADPLHEWQSPPFEPVVRGDYLYGRGASDDKGQLFCHLKAIESYLRTTGRLPVNVKCIFEGEEEIGSPSLKVFVNGNPTVAIADVLLVSDMPMPGPRQPALTYAMRGAVAMEIEVTGPSVDLHGGAFGGVIHNPIQALCETVARLHNGNGRIAIPGFYDDVHELDEAERSYLARTGPSNKRVAAMAGVREVWGESGYTSYERMSARPALTVNGISGGYEGTGAKAVIPARAKAKLNFRLVPNQNPAVIEELFRHHIQSRSPPDVRTIVRTAFKSPPVSISRDNRFLRSAHTALHRAFGVAPIFVRSGGTIPALSVFQSLMKIPIVAMGFGLPDDQIHAPNERFHLPNFFKGIETSIHFLSEASKLTRAGT